MPGGCLVFYNAAVRLGGKVCCGAPTSASGVGGATPSDEQGQREKREAWEQVKGLDPESQSIIHAPRWPVPGTISSPKGKRIDPFTGEESTHNGIDIRNPNGAAVSASESGEVIGVKPGSKGENQIKIRNRDGTVSIYAHTAPSVEVGDHVYPGTVIGNTDRSGRSTGPHLHYGIFDPKTGQYIDPETRLPKR